MKKMRIKRRKSGKSFVSEKHTQRMNKMRKKRR